MENRFQTEKVADISTLEEVYKLRAFVWKSMSEVSFPHNKWIDEHDQHSHHWVIREESSIVASARLCIHNSLTELPAAELFKECDIENGPFASLNRLVVHPEYQRLGLSKKLDSERISWIAKNDIKVILAYTWELSGKHRLRAFLNQGFEVISSERIPIEPFGLAIPVKLVLE